MKLSGAPAQHLTYCTNIHPGESLSEVQRALRTDVLAVKRAVSPDAPFGVGLRLSSRAVNELSDIHELLAMRDWLRFSGLYVFTVNGFPYGEFHGARVKENVYAPDWLDERRLRYTDRLAHVLCTLLPDDGSIEGSISTVPGAFKAVGGRTARPKSEEAEMARRMIQHAALLHRLRERTGKTISLALEPEPCCHLETTGETVAFFERWLFSPAAVDKLAQLARISASRAEDALHRHLGVCLDACHLAVEYEDPREALQRLARAGIRVAKVQLSTGLEAVIDPHSLEAMRAFADDTYLHQVVEAGDGELVRWADLPEAIEAAGDGTETRLWRVHFHVPIFLERLGRFRNTQRELKTLLGAVRASGATSHLEVETYSFGMLPEEHRPASMRSAIERELRWVLAEGDA